MAKGALRVISPLYVSPKSFCSLPKQCAGIVFQSFNLLNKLTLQENVELPLIYGAVRGRERNARALKALEAVGLSSWSRHRPGEVSGGQISGPPSPGLLLCSPPF